MIELIWGILNIAVGIYFVVICLLSTKIIREKLGFLASLVFVFGILSFVSKPNNEGEKSKVIDLQTQSNFEGNTYLKNVILENNIAAEIIFMVKFGEIGKEKKLISAQVNRSGFVSGTNWETENITFEKSDFENKYVYNVNGTLEWKIFGLKLYSESKEFKGLIELVK